MSKDLRKKIIDCLFLDRKMVKTIDDLVALFKKYKRESLEEVKEFLIKATFGEEGRGYGELNLSEAVEKYLNKKIKELK